MCSLSHMHADMTTTDTTAAMEQEEGLYAEMQMPILVEVTDVITNVVSEAEARSAVEALATSAGIDPARLVVLVTARRTGPATAYVTPPDEAAAEALYPLGELAGDAELPTLQREVAVGQKPLRLRLALLETEAADALLVPTMTDTDATDRRRFSLIIFQDQTGYLPADDEAIRAHCRSSLEREMQRRHPTADVQIPRSPEWCAPYGGAHASKCCLQYTISATTRLTPLSAYRFGVGELTSAARATTVAEVRRRRLAGSRPRVELHEQMLFADFSYMADWC